MTHDEKRAEAQKALDAFRKSKDPKGFTTLRGFLLDDELSSRSPVPGVKVGEQEYFDFKAAYRLTPEAKNDPDIDFDPLF